MIPSTRKLAGTCTLLINPPKRLEARPNSSGIEISPAMVDLQSNELREHNGNSYRDVEVELIDGRSFVNAASELIDVE